MNIFTKVGKMLFSPIQAIPHLKGADWILPVLLLVVVTTVATIAIYPTVIQPLAEQQLEKQMEKMGTGSAGGMEMAKKQLRDPAAQMLQSVLAGVVQAIGIILITLAIMAGGAITGGKGAKFSALFPVVCWAGLVGVIETLIRLPLMMMKESVYVSFSFAAFLDVDALGGPLYALLNQLSPFSLWWVAIVSAGVAYHYNFNRRKSVFLLLSLGTGWAVVSMVLAMFGGH